jgi:hypothetical protein
MTRAGNDPKVGGLVYVAAYAPDNGESAFMVAWKTLPSWYIVASNDHVISPTLQMNMAKRTKRKWGSLTIEQVNEVV